MGKTAGASDLDVANSDDTDEIFTDLSGTPDPLDRDLDVDALLGSVGKSRKAGEDGDDGQDELHAADEADDEEGAEGEGAEGEGAEGEGAEGDAAPDARDVALAFKDTELKTLKLEKIGLEAGYLEQQEANAVAVKTNAVNALKDWEDRLVAVKEAGDSKAEARLLVEGQNARDQLRAADANLGAINQRRAQLRGEIEQLGYDPATKSFKPAATDQRQPAVTTHVREFLARNPWVRDPANAANYRLLKGVDDVLAADPKWKTQKGSKEYVQELSARFNRVKPGLVRDLSGKLIGTGTQRRGAGSSAVASVGTRGADGRAVNAKDVKLTNADLQTMRTFGMDPQIKAHRAQWLVEKRAMTVKASGRA